MEFKPKFVQKHAIIESFLAGLGGILLIGIYIPIVIFAGGKAVAGVAAFLWFLTFLTFLIPAILYVIIKKRNYAKISYTLDDEKIIYYDGFFNIVRREIFYKRILEVDYSQNILQKMFDLGTVTLTTNNTSNTTVSGRSGIRIKDVENPEAVYEAVKKIVYVHIRAST